MEFAENFPPENAAAQFSHTDASAEASPGKTLTEKGLPAMCPPSDDSVTCSEERSFHYSR